MSSTWKPSELEKEQLREENRRLRQELENKYRITNIIGNSNKMREVFQMISQVSKSNATVLIRGESGTGKELVANSIHYNSLRAKKPFVKVNCAALPANLIESELFGHEKGAFTGAIKTKAGQIRTGQQRDHLSGRNRLRRPGRSGQTPARAAGKGVRAGRRPQDHQGRRADHCRHQQEPGTRRWRTRAFRGDLYYRLNVFPIYMPPLRERKTDILLLADHFLEKYAMRTNKDIRRFSTPAIDMLMDYHWPGNVRELENCIERAVLLCDEGVIHSYHLPPTLQTGEESEPSRPCPWRMPWPTWSRK